VFYVYLLYSAQRDAFYLGSTDDLKRRFQEHKVGLNRSTKQVDDWLLAYYEAYLTYKTAKRREARLKRSGKAYHSLKLRSRESLHTDHLGEGEALDRSPGKRRP
jgi:putative endonuclease